MKPTLAVNRAIIKVGTLLTTGKTVKDVYDATVDTFAVLNKVDGADYDKTVKTKTGGTPAGDPKLADLPEIFQFVAKNKGKIYKGLSPIMKKDIKSVSFTEARDYKGQVLKLTPKCKCESGFAPQEYLLKIHLNSDLLESFSAPSWTHQDLYYEVLADECGIGGDCETMGVYNNHLLVREIYRQYLEKEGNTFYKMEIKEGTNLLADLAAVDAYIAANKAVNTDSNKTNNSNPLTIVLTGLIDDEEYQDISVKYHYLRGLTMTPILYVDGKAQKFEADTAGSDKMVYGEGIGSDMRMLERELMSLHTNLNYNPTLSDNSKSPELVYQFENEKKYHVVTIEYFVYKSDKTQKNNEIVYLAFENKAEAEKFVKLFKE